MNDIKKVYDSVRKIVNYGEIYAVGGCVRDSILGIKPKDYDFATNLSPEEVRRLFKDNGRKVWESGIKFGTVGSKVLVDNKYIPVEITTYRSEKYQKNYRKPKVEFSSSLKEDLKRRDFTINALAYDGKEMIDYFAGKLDLLSNKRIKPVFDSNKMINDDPLRILRAIRFSVQLDFEIENNLFFTMRKNCSKLKDVAIERQEIELSKMFMINPKKSLDLLKETNYLFYFLPEINYYFHIKDSYNDSDVAWKDILSKTGEYINKEGVLTNSFKWRTNFINSGICCRFKFSNKRKKIIMEE